MNQFSFFNTCKLSSGLMGIMKLPMSRPYHRIYINAVVRACYI